MTAALKFFSTCTLIIVGSVASAAIIFIVTSGVLALYFITVHRIAREFDKFKERVRKLENQK